jgi:hypothetical protein
MVTRTVSSRIAREIKYRRALNAERKGLDHSPASARRRAEPQTAVDDQDEPVTKDRRVGTQEQSRFGDVVDRRQPTERARVFDHLQRGRRGRDGGRLVPSTTGPGAISAFTRTPAGPTPQRGARVSASTPAFAADACA